MDKPNNKPKTIGTSLAALKLVELRPPSDVPEIDMSLTPEQMEARAEEQGAMIRAEASKVYQAANYVQDFLHRRRNMSLEAQDALLGATDLTVIEAYLPNVLGHQMRAYRRAAILGILRAEFARPQRTAAAVKQLLSQLEREELIEEAPTGGSAFTAYGRNFTLKPAGLLAGFNPERDVELAKWINEVAGNLDGLIRMVGQQVEKTQDEVAAELMAKGNLTWGQVRAGQSGFWCANVPNTVFINKSGEPVFLKGGLVLAETNGEALFPLEAAGLFKVSPVIVKGDEVGIKIASLLTERWDLTTYVADRDQLKHIYFAAGLLARTARREEEEERIPPIRNDLSGRATVSLQEWILQGIDGVTLVDLRDYEIKDDQNRTTAIVPNLFFLIERKDGKIRILEIPEHLNDTLASCRDEYEEGSALSLLTKILATEKEKFSGVARDAEKEALINA